VLDISRCCFLNQPSLTEVCFLLTVFLGLFSIQTVFSQPIPPYVGQCIFFGPILRITGFPCSSVFIC